MTRTDSHSILLSFTRAAAICVAVLQLPVAVAATWGGFDDWGYVSLLGPVLTIALSVLLWRYADALLRAASARVKPATFDSDIAPREWQYLAFSAIGIWFVLTGTINLVWWLSSAALVNAAKASPTFQGYFANPDNLAGLLTAMFHLLAGVVLLFGARGLVELLRRFRER